MNNCIMPDPINWLIICVQIGPMRLPSDSYKRYLESLGLDDENSDADGPAFSIAELIRSFFPMSGIATVYAFGFAYPIPAETPIQLRGVTPHVPYSIYYPGPLGERHPRYGWVLDPHLVEGHLVKKGMTLRTWACHEPLERQLELYKTVKEGPTISENWRLKVEALHPLCVDEATWDFSELEEPMSGSESEPESELEAETSLETNLGGMYVHE